MTQQWPHLNRAPIVEAVIDFRLERSTQLELGALEALTPLLAQEYPSKKVRHRQQVEFKLEIGQQPTMNASPDEKDGFVFTSKDEKYIFQPQIEGFTLSRLEPYESWNRLYDEMTRLWKLYEQVAKPIKISRVGVRYVNKLKLPFPFKSFSEYLTAPPPIPDKLPQVLKSFFTRMVLPLQSIDAYAIVTQISSDPEGDILPVMLDIDLFRPVGFPEDTTDPWQLLQKFHDWKNEIFFHSITSGMVALCQ